jgi:hypothetical protein
MSFTLNLVPGKLTLAQLRQVQQGPVQLTLDSIAIPAIEKSAACVAEVIKQNKVVYGINTGFGLLANTRIKNEELELLQRSIVLSHAAGFGDFMDDSTVRLMLVLKINALARGFSGIRLSVIEALIGLVNAGLYPCIPLKGSVGASGDLAPLAHMEPPTRATQPSPNHQPTPRSSLLSVTVSSVSTTRAEVLVAPSILNHALTATVSSLSARAEPRPKLTTVVESTPATCAMKSTRSNWRRSNGRTSF